MAEPLESLDARRDVYALPIADRWLLYSPWTWTGAMVNHAAATAIARRWRDPTALLPKSLQPLWERLSSTPGAEATPLQTPEKIVVIPTRACNMRCVYCDFGVPGASTTTLDPAFACRLLDYYAAHLRASPEDPLRVHFFGGEPLVARACVEAIVHYARALCARKGGRPWFELTTNGLFAPDIVPFVGDYFHSVVISLDGDGPLHDFNRRRPDGRGTFADIAANIRRLLPYPVEISLRMCVTNRSVAAMADIAERFCNEFEFDVLGFEMLAENPSGRAAGLAAPDPFAFAAGVLRAEAAAARHDVRVVHGPSELTGPRLTSCPFGRGTLMLTPEGRLSACYLDPRRGQEAGLDLAIGEVKASSGAAVDRQKLDALLRLVQSKPRCRRCFCRYTCAGGCHIEQTPPGCSLEYDDRCRAIRSITAARLVRALGGSDAADPAVLQLDSMQALANHSDDRLAAWPLSCVPEAP